MPTQVIPHDDRVLLKRVPAPTISKGGLHLPGGFREHFSRGEVVRTGPGAVLQGGERSVLNCKVGEIVIFMERGSIPMEFDGCEYVLVPEGAVLATLEETPDQDAGDPARN